MCSKKTCCEEVIGEAMRGAANEVGGCWCHDDDLSFPSQANMIEGVARTEYLAMHRPPRNSLERYCSDELASGASHHHIDFSAGLCKQTRQPH